MVQCRRGSSGSLRVGPEIGDDTDEKRSRRRLRDLRKSIGWSVRASGQGDALKSMSVLENMFGSVPLGEQAREARL